MIAMLYLRSPNRHVSGSKHTSKEPDLTLEIKNLENQTALCQKRVPFSNEVRAEETG